MISKSKTKTIAFGTENRPTISHLKTRRKKEKHKVQKVLLSVPPNQKSDKQPRLSPRTRFTCVEIRVFRIHVQPILNVQAMRCNGTIFVHHGFLLFRIPLRALGVFLPFFLSFFLPFCCHGIAVQKRKIVAHVRIESFQRHL